MEEMIVYWFMVQAPVRLEYLCHLKQEKKFDHWKIAYEMGYDRYVKDLMDTDATKGDKISLYKGKLIQSGPGLSVRVPSSIVTAQQKIRTFTSPEATQAELIRNDETATD